MGTLLAFAGRAKVPRQECNLLDERFKVVARVLDGERIGALCREFGISRKTVHKIISRYVMPADGKD
ncbi:helix-turn-helix domain-containing protein [Rhizobium redzepovicii]|uniref:Helix-turn-helix domain-containing protein n=1 Tax=Rhizobium redzepovicii TaxID=2867518 RepID=A0AAW8P8H6_9HYPH|nr:helix-turn-helix domain-containing protein [Rhizobium redzepovicii]MDR9762856.1 helix-turn-helix domain-containing protein [Rhizobium redzepovicii]